MFDPSVLARPGTVLLDTSRTDAENRWSWCFTAPERVITAQTPAEVPSAIAAVDEATAGGAYVAGYLSYEAGYAFVDLEAPAVSEAPLAWFGVYEAPERVHPAAVARGLSTLEDQGTVGATELGVSEAAYTEAIEQVRRHIGAGDVYQINYTAPAHFTVEGDPRALYRRLRQRQHVPYGAYLNLGGRQILSLSPELFFRMDGREVTTRPMKGTIRRGRTLVEDQSLRESLRADPKNRAENLMIVDLLRNDLSVSCEPGSVEVPGLYDIEPYDTVTQMTSTVTGRLRSGEGLPDLLRALFPCGSITGAPKRRAMRIIRSLEPEPRGVYCGAIGMAGPDGSATFNVAIRTVVVEEGTGTMGVGSGVVWDSEPNAEYEECKLKTQFLTPGEAQPQWEPDTPLRLLETMRVEDGTVFFLDRHLDRLARSAAYFGYPVDRAALRRRVARRAAGMPGTQKLRLTLDRWGRVRMNGQPIDGGAGPWSLTVASQRVDSEDPLFYHKTTHRAVYTAAREEAQATGCDEALLLNEVGAVTEGAISNIFARFGDRWLTPPVDCGLLGGVYRDYVLETRPYASEAVLTLDDLTGADALYCCNAVRGWVEASLSAETS